ncbi:hypothetical protein [Bradyrhizobium sp. MOS003]|uniref:hypothetical protein n=1 Tax=Bradyrhizobium sp. MOS003 TaxID=2133946 RepID=UPI0018F4FEFA|nr:hypothetical protein [Bradyrhizobium sp. MOS003]
MLKSNNRVSRLVVAAFAACVLASSAFAQQAPAVRIRGTIESVDGNTLAIKTREGTDVKVRMTDNVAVFAVVKTSLSEIKDGSYIGVTGMPEPDGTQKAIAVHIFPENQRGAAEGFRPWDARANSTMTNATVAQTVKGTDGQNVTVKYKDGEKKVVVPPDTPIVTFIATDKSEVKPGAKLIIFGAAKKDDGTLEANRINVGRDGITPPM